MEIAAGILVAFFALALISIPLFAKRPHPVGFKNDGEIRTEVDRYRSALKAKTLCERCLTANPAKSNYCSECGRGL